MQAVTFQAPGEVRLEERPEPELLAPDDAVVGVEATGVCGSDLHIYHGRVQMDPGFTLGHEFVGTVLAAGDAVTEVAEGDRVLGLGPVGLCAVQAAKASGAARVIAVDSVEDRLRMAESFGAEPVHLTEGDPRGAVKAATEGRGVDVAVDAVGHPDALDMAARLTRKAGTVSAIGVYAERIEVHMGVVWIKALTLRTGHANVIAHVDRVLAMMAAGVLDPGPLVTHHMGLEDAAEAYAVYDRHEALKIVMTP